MTVDYPAHTYVTHEGLAAASLTTASGSVTISSLQQGATNAQTGAPGPKTFGFGISNPGGGVPVSNLPPTRLGTFYMKL